MATALSPRKVSVGTSAVLLSGAGTLTRGRLFRNLGGTSVFLGGETVTAATGWEVPAGEDFPDSISTGAIYGIRASGTSDVHVWEVK